jgi:hypothetical protein
MFGLGPQDVTLLGHAPTSPSLAGKRVRAIAACQTGGFGVIELLLKFGVSLAALAVGASPHSGIAFGYAAVRAC